MRITHQLARMVAIDKQHAFTITLHFLTRQTSHRSARNKEGKNARADSLAVGNIKRGAYFSLTSNCTIFSRPGSSGLELMVTARSKPLRSIKKVVGVPLT